MSRSSDLTFLQRLVIFLAAFPMVMSTKKANAEPVLPDALVDAVISLDESLKVGKLKKLKVES